MKLLELLKAMFGQKYLNNIIGTKTNVSKPIKLDKNSPFKLYSDSAFENPEVVKFIEKKLAEYGPYALSNKNLSEVKNYEMNLRRALNKKQPKESQVKKAAEAMFGPIGKKEKPEAEVVDIKTQEKVKPEGIMKLKTELGLPKGVEPGSIADKAIKESAQYKMDQQGVTSVLDENYKPPKSELTLEEEEAIAKLNDRMAKGYSAMQEGKRRAVIRQILLKDKRINLPEDVEKSLKNYDDLRGGGDQNMDPLKIFERYYERDNEVLGTLDGIIDTAENEFKAADTFLAGENNFKVKKPVVRESLDDEAVEIEESEILDDPDEFSTGGRVGFSKGGIKALIEMMNKKFGKDTIKTADEVKVTDEMLFERDKRRLLEELEDYKEIAPQFYQRMTLKIKYPGISDELIAKIMADDDPQRIAEVMATMDEAFKMMDKGMGTDEILKTFKTTPRTKNAGGGLNYLMGL
jgi:hypothetical protein